MEKTAPSDTDQPLLDHLEELRRRLFVTLGVLALLSIACYFVVDPLITFLARSTGGFVFTRPTEAFLVRLKISFIAGLFLSVPILLYEAWRFVGAALTPGERRIAGTIVPVSYVLFALGAACAWFVVLPTATRFLLGYATQDLRPLLSLDAYVEFLAWFTIAFGLLFQMPLVILFLVRAGLVTPQGLAAYRRHVILGLAILSAALTPGPDVFSQLALFVPTYFLYEVSVWIARWRQVG